jgi:outer membrane receptor protein involved in Fe transport
LFARNLTEKNYFESTFSQPLVFSNPQMGYTGDPRTYGVTLSVRFGN